MNTDSKINAVEKNWQLGTVKDQCVLMVNRDLELA
jgi:hypothetical protein